MDVLKVKLAASEVNVCFQMTNQLSTQSSITKTKCITAIARGLTQTHSTFVLGILKHLNMVYLNMKKNNNKKVDY